MFLTTIYKKKFVRRSAKNNVIIKSYVDELIRVFILDNDFFVEIYLKIEGTF